MWGDSVPNGSLQWSISCLVCEPLWINVWKDHSARSLMQKTTVDLAQHPAAQLPSCPAFQHIVPRAAFAFQFLSFCFDSLCINVWQVSKLWNALIGIVEHARRHLSMRHLEKNWNAEWNRTVFKKCREVTALGESYGVFPAPWHLGNLPCCGRAKCHATARDPMKFGWDSERFRRWTCSLRQAKDKVKFHLARLAYQGQLHKQRVILLDPFFVLKETVSLSEGHSWPCNFLVLLALLLPRTRKKRIRRITAPLKSLGLSCSCQKGMSWPWTKGTNLPSSLKLLWNVLLCNLCPDYYLPCPHTFVMASFSLYLYTGLLCFDRSSFQAAGRRSWNLSHVITTGQM